jgi:putative ABC transport system substrate-binding protein
MRRRHFLTGVALLLPRAARAQQKERVHRIGYLTPATGAPGDELGDRETRALVEGLRELSWVDGHNITIDHRFSGSGRARIEASAKELVALKPDVILTVGGPPLAAVMAETKTIPVVFTVVGDPVKGGFVSNLAHPGGNVTGFSVLEGTVAGKWPQLLKEIAPGITRVMVVMEADSPPQLVMHDAVAAAAPALGLVLTTAVLHDVAELDQQVEQFAREPSGGLVVFSNTILANNLQHFHTLALRCRLPAVYSYPIYAETGGLISYGPNPVEQLRQATRYIDKILRGTKPGDLPVQQPTKYSLAVNLQTANSLGLTVPQSILARADEVIE